MRYLLDGYGGVYAFILINNAQNIFNCSLKQQYVILSVRLVVWVGAKTDGSKVSSKPYYPRVAGNR